MTDQYSHSDGALSANYPAAAAAIESLDCDPTDGSAPDRDELCARLSDRDVDPVVATLLESLAEERDRLAERVDELPAQLDRIHDIATTASGTSETNANALDDLESDHEETRAIARSAVAKAQQADADQQADAESLPEGIDPVVRRSIFRELSGPDRHGDLRRTE